MEIRNLKEKVLDIEETRKLPRGTKVSSRMKILEEIENTTSSCIDDNKARAMIDFQLACKSFLDN